jgi:hypothetical protein
MDDREMLWRCGDPFDNRLDFCREAGSQFGATGAVPITRFD